MLCWSPVQHQRHFLKDARNGDNKVLFYKSNYLIKLTDEYTNDKKKDKRGYATCILIVHILIFKVNLGDEKLILTWLKLSVVFY